MTRVFHTYSHFAPATEGTQTPYTPLDIYVASDWRVTTLRPPCWMPPRRWSPHGQGRNCGATANELLSGERLCNSRSWRARFAELTHLAPPMTPVAPDLDGRA